MDVLFCMIDDDSGEVSAMKLWPSTGAKCINEKLLAQWKFCIEKIIVMSKLIIFYNNHIRSIYEKINTNLKSVIFLYDRHISFIKEYDSRNFYSSVKFNLKHDTNILYNIILFQRKFQYFPFTNWTEIHSICKARS